MYVKKTENMCTDNRKVNLINIKRTQTCLIYRT